MRKKLNHFKICITLKYAPHLSIAIEASSLVYPILIKDDNLLSSSNTVFVISCKIDPMYMHIISNNQKKKKTKKQKTKNVIAIVMILHVPRMCINDCTTFNNIAELYFHLGGQEDKSHQKAMHNKELLVGSYLQKGILDENWFRSPYSKHNLSNQFSPKK